MRRPSLLRQHAGAVTLVMPSDVKRARTRDCHLLSPAKRLSWRRLTTFDSLRPRAVT